MKTIIHIGQHQTATTSIQHFLKDKRKLLKKTGLYVPTMIAGYDNPAHFILDVYALDQNRFSARKEQIIEERGWTYLDSLDAKLQRDIKHIYKNAATQDCDRVLWSDAGLYLLNSESEYQKLKALFSDYCDEVEVVCCFRDVRAFRDSYISQLFQQHLTQSQDADSYRYVGTDSWLFDYDLKKQLLEKVFDHCTYFQYDAEDNVKVFLQTIGYEETTGTQKYRRNVTANNHDLRHKIITRFSSLVH